ncbi:hypothetical protein BHM03_00058710 [Ensete ventricosum]|nr:hypothetical protein BHM03_00058710 [Ensete ventricosum]
MHPSCRQPSRSSQRQQLPPSASLPSPSPASSAVPVFNLIQLPHPAAAAALICPCSPGSHSSRGPLPLPTEPLPSSTLPDGPAASALPLLQPLSTLLPHPSQPAFITTALPLFPSAAAVLLPQPPLPMAPAAAAIASTASSSAAARYLRSSRPAAAPIAAAVTLYQRPLFSSPVAAILCSNRKREDKGETRKKKTKGITCCHPLIR